MNNTSVKRTGAFAIDLILIIGLIIVIENTLPGLFEDHSLELFDLQFRIKVHIQYLLYVPYFLFFDFVSRGNSLGKMIFDLRVCNREGEFVELPTRVFRTLVKIISISVLPLSMIVYFLTDGFTLHDLLLKTKVESSTT